MKWSPPRFLRYAMEIPLLSSAPPDYESGWMQIAPRRMRHPPGLALFSSLSALVRLPMDRFVRKLSPEPPSPVDLTEAGK